MKGIKNIAVCLLVAGLFGCNGGGGGSDIQGTRNTAPTQVPEIDCLANERNCEDDDVDLFAPIYWAADNGVRVVHIRWAGCCDNSKFFEAVEYAFERGTIVIWPAGDSNKRLVSVSNHMIVAKSTHKNSNRGPATHVSLGIKGTIHSGIAATAYIVMLYEELNPTMDKAGATLIRDRFLSDKHKQKTYPGWSANVTVMIVDNGFDSVRPDVVMYKNTALAGEVTGDYGIKAVNELWKWVKTPVIGYVPFNTAPEEPRIDNWEIL